MEPGLCLLLRAPHTGPQDSGPTVCTPLGPGAPGMVVCKGESSGHGRFKQVEGRSTELPRDSVTEMGTFFHIVVRMVVQGGVITYLKICELTFKM